MDTESQDVIGATVPRTGECQMINKTNIQNMLACFKYDRCWWVLEQEGAVPGMVRVDSVSQRLRKPAVQRL